MKIDDLTIGEAKRLAGMFGGSQQGYPDKDYGWIVLILRNGFVFVGKAKRVNGVGIMSPAFQVRYWSKRDGGLPEFAEKGKSSDDKLDAINGDFEFPWSDFNVIGVLPCGMTWKKQG